MRRLALESLEPRCLMAVLPAPMPDPQVAFDVAGTDSARIISNDGLSLPGNDSSPQIVVNRYNPNKMVAVWVDHDTALGNPPAYGVRGAFSVDAGLTWTRLTGLPPTHIDPSTGSNPQPFSAVSNVSVTFDGKDNFYVLEIQHSADYVTAGEVLVQPYSFSGSAPAAKPTTNVYAWNRSATVPIVKAIRDATIMADDNLPTFTDPTTGLVQTDPGANRVYIAWQDDVPLPSGYPAGLWNFNTVELLTSLNGGASFGAPVLAGADHPQGNPSYEADAAPRLAISQGRAAGTNGPTDPGTPGGQVSVLFDDFHRGNNFSPPVDLIYVTPFTPSAGGSTSLGQQLVAITSVRGAANLPYPLATPSSSIGVGPGASIASDNTLGSFHASSGRLYVAYTDRYDNIRFPGIAANNPADNTDVFLKYSDDGGFTWNFAKTDQFGTPLPVNDDNALTDGFSAASTFIADNKGNLTVSSNITGRPQYQPQLAVDPVTGTLAVSYYDVRFDPSKARAVQSVQLSDGVVNPATGNLDFSASTQADIQLTAYDQTINRNVSLGPIPMNQGAKPDAGQLGAGGAGDHQGLAIYGGKLWDVFISNVNGGVDTAARYTVHVAPMVYATGPRVISSTMGQAATQTVFAASDPNHTTPITFNNQVATDGTPILDGFIVTFDRPIDASTFTRADVTVTFRDPFTSGSVPGIPVPITQDPIALDDGSTRANAGGTTKYLVRFAPQSNVGTYSYTVGPDIRDLYRNTLATNTYYAQQTPINLPTLPPSGTGGSGQAVLDNAKSTLNVQNVPANQNILDVNVLVTLSHQRDGDLVLKLIPPPGVLPAGQFILLSQNEGGNGANYTATVFDDQATTPIAFGAAPFTGSFQPDGLLSVLNGKSPNGTWTLEIDDTRSTNTGKLVSWGLQITTSNRSFDGNFTQAGVAAQTGDLMDQNGNGIGGENPNTGGVGSAPGSEIVGLAPGDVYAVPTPNPTTPEIFNGQNVNPPYDPTTLPLMISGPHVIRSFVPGAARPTADNLITDQAVTGFDIVFDRDMDPNTIVLGNHVARVATPFGTFTPGQILPDGSTLVFQIKADPNADPNNPGSDPDTIHARTYQVQFMHIPAGGTNPVPYALTQSGTYSVTLTSDIQSEAGDPLDSNQNAGLDFLRGTPSAGTLPQTYTSQAPVAIGPGLTNESDITVPDSFQVKNVVVGLNITYPQDAKLTATLTSPDGFSILLFSNVGNVGTGANFTNTFLDDAAQTPIANGGPPFFGTFNPQQPLSQFVDHFSAGTWRLTITVPAGAPTGTINSWSLKLAQPLSNSGLGELVADQATQSFRIFTFDPTNPLAANTWTAIGPAGEGAKISGGNAEVAGRVNAIAVDPSDPSGNTVFIGAPSGGIWKTTDFLTQDPSGPTYVPLTDNASVFGMNIASIAIFPRNNDPNQSIIFAATGDSSLFGDNVRDQAGTQRGIGFLRSMDGGATWTLLDSRNNTSAASRDHFFASVPGQAGVTSFKIVVDPKAAPNGQVIVYAALSDIDANGNRVTAGPKGGIWKSLDSGTTWTLMRGGQATDITLDYNSVNANSGNLDFLYAAFRGDGVYFSPNAAQSFDLMTGDVGGPLIQDVDASQPQPVTVGRTVPITTPNGKLGRIVLAKPARKVNPDGSDADPLYNLITQGWLYAAVVDDSGGNQPVISGGSSFIGLYLTKDFGQTWTPVAIPALTTGAPELPTNDIRNATIAIGGTRTPAGSPFTLGNFALSLAVDPNNPNVVYLGSTSEFRNTGLIRVDTTGIHDAHAFYTENFSVSGGLRTAIADGAVQEIGPGRGLPPFTPPYEPAATPFINLIRDPASPFQADATILVQNTQAFINDGAHTTWTPFDQAVTPNPYANQRTDPWSQPTRNVHQILTYTDPLTGQSRLLVATDQGVYTAVADAKGTLVGSIGDQVGLNTDQGNVTIVNGSRNGNLAIAQFEQGAAQPSQLASQLAALTGFFYGATRDSGLAQSNPNIINATKDAQGNPLPGYGDLSYNVDTINGPNEFAVGVGGTVDRGTFIGLATQQNVVTSANGQQAGNVYDYRISEDLIGIDGRPSTDTVQVNDIGRTFRLYQTSNPGDTPDAQWPFRLGFNLVVNPLSADQMLISSNAGRVFATTTQGRIWSEIGNPGALDGTKAQALAYGAPDPAPPGGGLGTLNNYIFAGTQGGKIFVTFTGGGGVGNAWTNLSGGLDGSPVQMIVTNPTRGSHEAYAVTKNGVYHMADALAGGNWVNVTGNLFSVLQGQFNNPSLGTQTILKYLTAIQADWRYLIPNDFTNPSAGTHPMLYAAGEGGVFRSLDGGQTWGLYPDGAVTATGTFNSSGLLFSPAGQGGGLPNDRVTDLDLSLGNIDPTTGRPNVASGPNLLMASTYGRGAYAIRLAPIVFPNSATNTSILTLSPTLPVPPGGSDSSIPGVAGGTTDFITNVTTPVIEGLSEQSAFGNSVTVALYDVSDFSQAELQSLLAGIPTRLPVQIPTVAGTNQTDATGHFAVQVAPGYFKAFDPANPNAVISDGNKKILVQATNQSGTKGNFAPLGLLDFNNPNSYSFILDTTPPIAPGTPDLTDASDAGLDNKDNITNINGGLAFTVTLSTGEPATTHVYLVRDGNVVDEQFGSAAPGAITLTDPGPVPDGDHFYSAYEIDAAGNKGPSSGTIKVRIDTIAPSRPSQPILDPTNPTGGSDSGIVGDNITNVKKPSFAGTAEAGGLVQIIDAAGNVLGPVAGTPSYRSTAAVPIGPGTPSTVYTSTINVPDDLPLKNVIVGLDIAYPLDSELTATLVAPDGTSVQLFSGVGTGADFTGTFLNDSASTPISAGDSPFTGRFKPQFLLDQFADHATKGTWKLQIQSTANLAVPVGQITDWSLLLLDVTANGRYRVTPTNNFADGTYTLRVREEDVAGNFSQPSTPITVTILSRTPATPSLFLVAADDTGIVGDNITSNNQPRLIGASTPGLSVQLILDSGTIPGVAIGGVIAPTAGQQPIVVASDGSYLIKFPNKLADGTYVVHTVVSDIAGNSAQSAKLTLTILGGGIPNPNPDPNPTPAAPTLALSPADDTGIVGDNITTVRRPHFVGSARYSDGSIAAGVPIDLIDTTGRVLASSITTTTGTFTLSLPNDLSNGSIGLQARLRDVAGNPGPASNVVNLKIITVTSDVNNDGRADLGSFNRATSTFSFSNAAAPGTPGSGPISVTAPFLTAPGDIPLQGDFDGDGKSDYGFYRPSTGQWFVAQSRAGWIVFNYGLPNDDIPVPADYDGDGRTDFAVFRKSTGLWSIFQSQSGTQKTVFFGVPGLDQPVPADYDGDGKADFAVYRPSTGQWLAALTPGGNLGFNAPSAALPVYNTQYGLPNVDVPVPADYNGDGKTDVAVYRPTTGQWFFDFSTSGVYSAAWGLPNVDIPVPGDYDGDGRADLGVFRPTDASWHITTWATPARSVVSGSPNDVPLAAPLVPYRIQGATTVQLRSLVGSSGSNFSTDPAAGPDLGRTAANFSANSGAAKSSAPTSVTPPTFPASRRHRPAQAAPAKANHHHKPATGNGNGHHHDAALAKLGRFKLKHKHV